MPKKLDSRYVRDGGIHLGSRRRPRISMGRIQWTERDTRASPFELFFDLVFVFALTRVVDVLAKDASAQSVVRCIMVLAVLWWSWVGYVWLCNIVKPDAGIVRSVMIFAMIGIFAVAITIPEAFVDHPGGLNGPMIFACGYAFVRGMDLIMLWAASRDDPTLRKSVGKIAPSMVVGVSLLFTAQQLPQGLALACAAIAVLTDYVGLAQAGIHWRLNAVSHFAERHGLIIIVALGESIVAIGMATSNGPVSISVLVMASFGLAITTALWWLYFDTTAVAAEEVLDNAEHRFVRMARNCYSFSHLAMMIGIVMTALGLKKALQYPALGHITDKYCYVLYAGIGIYLFALIAFQRFTVGGSNVPRIVTLLALGIATPIAPTLPAVVVLAVPCILMATAIMLESVHIRKLEGSPNRAETDGR